MTPTPQARCDLLIIGAGPAGMAAALAAAPSGMRITVVDDNPGPGGQIWGRASSRVTSRHFDHGRSSRVFISRSNRPYGLTCSQISGVRAA